VDTSLGKFEEDGGEDAKNSLPSRNRSELYLVRPDSASLGSAANADVAAIPLDRVELESLRELLREQQRATLRALETATDLQTRLTSAESEVEKIGTQYRGFSKLAGSNDARKAAENADLHSQWHNAQRELETQRRERRIEAVRTAARVSTLEKELEAKTIAPEIARLNLSEHRGRKRKVRGAMIAAAGVVAVTGLSFVCWRVTAAHGAQSADAQLIFAPPTAAYPVSALPAESTAAFSMAVNRLDDALAAIPGRTPEDVLQQASKNQKACRLQWNDGHPSLLFDGEPSRANSLSETINECADAVKRLR
jgi:hypothetical protein